MDTRVRIAALVMGLAPVATSGAEPTAIAIEFRNSILSHYFITADPAEAAAIDAGSAGPGWTRTGGQFGVFRGASDATGLAPVCRFYGAGPNSHFYTSDAAECASVRAPGTGWAYEGIAFYVTRPSGANCSAGETPVYRTYNNGAARNDSNHRFTVDATVFAKAGSYGHLQEGVVMCAALSASDRTYDAARLARQATFGPTPALVERIASIGAAAWIEEQASLPATRYADYPWMPANRPDSCVDDRTPPLRADSFCARDNYTLFPLQLEFFRNAIAQPDQLRARVAFALSQIMVTSGLDNNRAYAMQRYQQIFVERGLGNFYDLMLAVSLSPVMGDYLDMANNNKANPATGTEPNENYAREIMQLFTIGTFMLNADGTPMFDASGKRIPTYDQEEIEGFAHVFTGWTYPPVQGAQGRNNNPRNYLGNMVAVTAQHDFGPKTLLRGVTAPANLTMQEDLEFAHGNIFTHPNVGPFIGKQLIQKLVTSEPTPGYVSRVTAAFNNNGVGQRGDLKAVVRAILLDPEARGARKIDPAYGKLVEPVLYMTHVARAFGAASDGVVFRLQSQQLGQFVFYPPSVFNFYPPDFVVPNTQLLGPEFGVQTTTTAINRANFANSLIFSNGIPADTSVYGATGTMLDLSSYQAVANDANALVDRLDRNLMGGTMSTAMKGAIVTAVNAVAASDPLNRARTAAYLVVTSPQYQVTR
jgi:uncharacterized protein (DUF1800 family)